MEKKATRRDYQLQLWDFLLLPPGLFDYSEVEKSTLPTQETREKRSLPSYKQNEGKGKLALMNTAHTYFHC